MKEEISKAAQQSKTANDATRRDWGAISPVTKVIPNKKRKAQTDPKYKNKGDNE